MKDVVDDDDGHEDSEVRVSSASLGDLMRREAEESPCTSSRGVRCWQPGEVEVEDRWGISFELGAPPVRAASLDKSKSRQLHGSRRVSLHRVGRRVFSCFRHSTISLTVPGLEPSTPPKSGPITAPRKSASGANGVTFLHEATDHRHRGDDDEDGESVEPTSPVVNCMGQVQKQKQRCCKKVEAPAPATPKESFMDDDREKFRRTKSQAPTSMSPPMASKSKSCKWKQLLRSNSSSISPSNHPCGSELGSEPEIDLGRFSSASASQPKMRRRSEDTSKPPDRTCMLMRRSHSSRSSDDYKLLDGSESEPVFRVLPSLKTTKIESPKWLADETRQGFCKRSSTSKYTHV